MGIEQNVEGKFSKTEIFRMLLAGCIYQLWFKRNQRIFQGNACPWDVFTDN